MPAPWGQERNRDGGEAACHSGDRHEEVDSQRATDLPPFHRYSLSWRRPRRRSNMLLTLAGNICSEVLAQGTVKGAKKRPVAAKGLCIYQAAMREGSLPTLPYYKLNLADMCFWSCGTWSPHGRKYWTLAGTYRAEYL